MVDAKRLTRIETRLVRLMAHLGLDQDGMPFNEPTEDESMNKEKFLEVYNESRNGTDDFYRHPLVRNFAYSSGVQELADTGCYWLVDIIATELLALFEANEEISNRCMIHIEVEGGKAYLEAEFEDDVVAWSKKIAYTDMPDGKFTLMLANEYKGTTPFRLILLTEY